MNRQGEEGVELEIALKSMPLTEFEESRVPGKGGWVTRGGKCGKLSDWKMKYRAKRKKGAQESWVTDDSWIEKK